MNPPLRFSHDKDALELLDQRFLPLKQQWYDCVDVATTIFALQKMVVRGAPAIGVTAAYGCYLAARQTLAEQGTQQDTPWQERLRKLLDELRVARPTAVNLQWAVSRMEKAWQENATACDANSGNEKLCALWLDLAHAIHEEDNALCRQIGSHGACIIDPGDTIMTHCNAGALATGGYGTALGVIRGAWEAGKKDIRVIANETRPFLQGARLTAWELDRDGIPVRVACDNACALLMQQGHVNKVIVGADRIAANGDVANKIGTLGVALLASHFSVPFYVAAPLSTIDSQTVTGQEIPIEDRPPEEVTHVGDTQIVPDGIAVYNLAFDVTPAQYITGIITEKGILSPPYIQSIEQAR